MTAKTNKEQDIITYEGDCKTDVNAAIPAALTQLDFESNGVDVEFEVIPLPKRFLQWRQEQVLFRITGKEKAVQVALTRLLNGIEDYNRRVGCGK